MYVSWNTLAKDGCPVRGDPSAYQQLAQGYAATRDRIRQADDNLSAIRFGTSREFRGAAADAFATHIANVSEPLGALPGIAHDLSAIFETHEKELDRLITKAAEALARAEVHWDEKQDAALDKQRYCHQLQSISDQLSSMSAVDEHSRERLLDHQEDVRGRLESADQRELQAEARLGDITVEWDQIREQEIEQNEQTASYLRSIELGPMADPGFWENLGSKVLGTFLLVLEGLHELLGVVLVILVIAALVMGLGPLIVGLMLAVSLVKLAIGITLHQNGRLSTADLWWDVADVAFSLVSFGSVAAKTLAQGRVFLQANTSQRGIHLLIPTGQRLILASRGGNHFVPVDVRMVYASLRLTRTTIRVFPIVPRSAATLFRASQALGTASKATDVISIVRFGWTHRSLMRFDHGYPPHFDFVPSDGMLERLTQPLPVGVSSGRLVLAPCGLGA